MRLIYIDNFPDTRKERFDPRPYFEPFRQSDAFVLASSTDYHFPTHWGPLSLKGVTLGAEHYRVGDRKYTVTPEHYLLLNPGVEYSSFIQSPSKEVNSFALFYTERTVNQFRNSLRSAEVNLDNPGASITAIDFTERLYPYSPGMALALRELILGVKVEPPDQLLLGQMILEVLGRMLETQSWVFFETADTGAKRKSTQKELYKRLHFVRDYIHSNYGEDITLEVLADLSMLSSAYMLRQFKKLFGITPYQMLLRRRFSVAHEMLQKREFLVSDICCMVGYKDPTSFGKKYKQIYGHPPSTVDESVSCKN